MAYEMIELTCPSCGARVRIDQKTCDYCYQPVIISSFHSVKDMNSMQVNKYINTYRKALADHPEDVKLNASVAMCYLQLKMYDKAHAAFDKAIEDNFDDSETYFYAAVCLLGGKKAFLQQLSVIRKAEEYLGAAISIEPRGIYYYFLAYLRYDYYERKRLKAQQGYRETLQQANEAGVSQTDVAMLYELLQVEQPAELA